MDARARRRDDVHMSLDLTDAELAATACRGDAFQEGERAKALENPNMGGLIERWRFVVFLRAYPVAATSVADPPAGLGSDHPILRLQRE